MVAGSWPVELRKRLPGHAVLTPVRCSGRWSMDGSDAMATVLQSAKTGMPFFRRVEHRLSPI
jgi:hypothetical protein